MKGERVKMVFVEGERCSGEQNVRVHARSKIRYNYRLSCVWAKTGLS